MRARIVLVLDLEDVDGLGVVAGEEEVFASTSIVSLIIHHTLLI